MNSRLMAGATVAALLAVPSAANAAGTVMAGPVKVRDYQMTLVGTDAGAKDSLTVMFLRSSGKSTQQHVYSFAKNIKVTRTSIKGSLGKYGSVNLTLRNRRTAKRSLPKGCTGSPGKTVTGTFTGRFRLVADKTYFRTVSARSLRAVVTSNGSIRCGGDGGGDGGGGGGDALAEPMLTLSSTDPGGMFTFTARRTGQMAMRMEDDARTAPASIMHMINAGGTGLTLGGGSTATAKGLTPFLGGTGTFSGTGTGPVIPGVLSGDLIAKFDSIDDVRISGDAMLMTGR